MTLAPVETGAGITSTLATSALDPKNGGKGPRTISPRVVFGIATGSAAGAFALGAGGKGPRTISPRVVFGGDTGSAAGAFALGAAGGGVCGGATCVAAIFFSALAHPFRNHNGSIDAGFG